MEPKLSLTAQRILQLRQENGLTQLELAEKTNLERKSIIRYENGQSVPSGRALTALARFFGVSADYLLGLSDIPTLLPAHESELTHLELEALRAFRRASSDDQRRRLLEALQSLVPAESA